MAKVFLVERNNRFDLTSAEEFGEIAYFTKAKINPLEPEAAVSVIMENLYKFDPEEDYICLTGGSLTVAMFLSAVTQIHPQVKILLFDARHGVYRSRILDLRGV